LLADVERLAEIDAELGLQRQACSQCDAQQHAFHRRPPSEYSTCTAVSLPSRAKRSAEGLSERYDCAFASAAGSGLAFFMSSGERPRTPVLATFASCAAGF